MNIVRRIRLLGFNAIRLPFSMKVDRTCAELLTFPFHSSRAAVKPQWRMLQAIFESEPKNYNTWCPYFPDRYSNPTVDDILHSVTPPGMEVAKGA